LEESDFAEAEAAAEEVRLKHTVWTSLKSWAGVVEALLVQPLSATEPTHLEHTVGAYLKVIHKVDRGLAPNQVRRRLAPSCLRHA
jgi:hypothetical protein